MTCLAIKVVGPKCCLFSCSFVNNQELGNWAQLQYNRLMRVFTNACRIGTEHEKLGYYKDSKRRMTYKAIEHILWGLCQKHKWKPIMEGEFIIGAEKDGQSVTIEPGGQFELSGAPVDSLHDTLEEVSAHIEQVGSLQSSCAFG